MNATIQTWQFPYFLSKNQHTCMIVFHGNKSVTVSGMHWGLGNQGRAHTDHVWKYQIAANKKHCNGEQCAKFKQKFLQFFCVQIHNASSWDLLWGGKNFRKIKRNVSLHYFAVERLISKRSSGRTVSSSFGFNIVVCQVLLLDFSCSLTRTYAYNISFLDTVFG